MDKELSLPEKLEWWAQNEEMVDQYYTAHGRDCMEAARILDVVPDLVAVIEYFVMNYAKPRGEMSITMCRVASDAIRRVKGA